MSGFGPDHLGAVLLALMALLGCGAAGWFVPRLIARIPEPTPDPEPESAQTGRVGLPPPPPKIAYLTLADRPGLAWRTAVASAVVAAALAVRIGGEPALVVLLPLVPIGVLLAVVDWHTTLLPTWIIAPTYGLLAVLVLVAAALEGDLEPVLRAALGWAVMGGFFLLLWLIYPRGLGYGDVRLSGVLGGALGYVGVSSLVVGLYASFLIGGLGGLLLGQLRLIDRSRFPFGPFMLVGAVVGILAGPGVATALGY